MRFICITKDFVTAYNKQITIFLLWLLNHQFMFIMGKLSLFFLFPCSNRSVTLQDDSTLPFLRGSLGEAQ